MRSSTATTRFRLLFKTSVCLKIIRAKADSSPSGLPTASEECVPGATWTEILNLIGIDRCSFTLRHKPMSVAILEQWKRRNRSVPTQKIREGNTINDAIGHLKGKHVATIPMNKTLADGGCGAYE